MGRLIGMTLEDQRRYERELAIRELRSKPDYRPLDYVHHPRRAEYRSCARDLRMPLALGCFLVVLVTVTGLVLRSLMQ